MAAVLSVTYFCALAGCLALVWSSAASALVVNIDTFTVTANTTIIQDTFDDGIPPPSGPFGANSYGTSGTFPVGSETGGKLTMNTATGALSFNALGQPRLGLRATLLTLANANGLGIDDDISVSGLFDLTIPVGPLFNAYGLQILDAGPSQPAQELLELHVRFNPITGTAGIFYLKQDFLTNTITVFGGTLLAPPIGTDQIFLELVRVRDTAGALTNIFDASFEYRDGGNIIGSGAFSSPLATMFDGEDFVRARFFASQDLPLPEPGTLVLLVVALAGLGFSRRRKLH